MKKIDINDWARKVPYENFIKYSDPIFSISARLDVTSICEQCAAEKTSFFANMLYVVSYVMNITEEFRLRLRDGEVVCFDAVDPNYIVMTEDGVIVTCRTEYTEDHTEFYARVRADIDRMKRAGTRNKSFNVSGENNCFYVSCLPWLDFTAVSNPYNLTDPDNCSIPRVTWGKFVDENGRKKMTLDIAAHHALLDGEPVCRVFNTIQDKINQKGFFK